MYCTAAVFSARGEASASSPITYAYGDCYDKWNVMMCGMFLEAFSSEQLAQEVGSDVKILHLHRVLSVIPCSVSNLRFPSFCGSESHTRLTTLAAPAPRLGTATWVNREWDAVHSMAAASALQRPSYSAHATTVRLVMKPGPAHSEAPPSNLYPTTCQSMLHVLNNRSREKRDVRWRSLSSYCALLCSSCHHRAEQMRVLT